MIQPSINPSPTDVSDVLALRELQAKEEAHVKS
jgi:hypothetical protein